MLNGLSAGNDAKSKGTDGGMKARIAILFTVVLTWHFICFFGVHYVCAQCFAAPIAESFIGEYVGTYVGDDYGTFIITISETRTIKGSITIRKNPDSVPLEGFCSHNGICEFYTSQKSILFRGKINFSYHMEGTWKQRNSSAKGIFIAVKAKP